MNNLSKHIRETIYYRYKKTNMKYSEQDILIISVSFKIDKVYEIRRLIYGQIEGL